MIISCQSDALQIELSGDNDKIEISDDQRPNVTVRKSHNLIFVIRVHLYLGWALLCVLAPGQKV